MSGAGIVNTHLPIAAQDEFSFTADSLIELHCKIVPLEITIYQLSCGNFLDGQEMRKWNMEKSF